MNTTSLQKKKKKKERESMSSFPPILQWLIKPEKATTLLWLIKSEKATTCLLWDKLIIKMFWTGWHLGHRVFHSSSWGRIIETVALAQTFTNWTSTQALAEFYVCV